MKTTGKVLCSNSGPACLKWCLVPGCRAHAGLGNLGTNAERMDCQAWCGAFHLGSGFAVLMDYVLGAVPERVFTLFALLLMTFPVDGRSAMHRDDSALETRRCLLDERPKQLVR